MISRTIAVGLIVAGCVTAAAGGAYLGVRHNSTASSTLDPLVAPSVPPAADASPAVSETEAVVRPEPQAEPIEAPMPVVRPEPKPRQEAVTARAESVRTRRAAAPARSRERLEPVPSIAAPPVDPARELPAPSVPAPVFTAPVRPVDVPSAPPEPQFEELLVPSSSVIGLQVETPVSSDRAQVEDRVDARVTRDVLAAGRVAIPAGSRVIGAVSLVERGGKVKERARLGVRFHTLVMGDGRQVPLRTEAILREGEPPSGESARKIGGAAMGGAILGAIMGGKKGAIIGGATGAGAGTAAVMAGDRNAATLAAGTIVTVRLAAPASIEVERR
jgi:hypothetical protein